MKRKLLGVIVVLTLVSSVSMYRGQLNAQQEKPGAAPSFQPVATPPVQFDSKSQHYKPLWTRLDTQHGELFELDQRTRKLADELKSKPDATKEEELKKLVEECFDKRHAAQVAEVKELSEKLAKMQETLKKREQKKQEILARRINQLMGDRDDLDWELAPSRPAPYPIAVPVSVPEGNGLRR